jgi:plasmid stabilization system protein ParE
VSVQIELSQQAQAMLDEADERWISEHGFDKENPLLVEVGRAADLLRENPELGVVYRQNTFRRDVRRLLLRSGWHLYYTLDSERASIVIVAVWFSNRDAQPAQ